MTYYRVRLAVLACLTCLMVGNSGWGKSVGEAGNLCVNGGFEGRLQGWDGGSFGKDAGFVRLTDKEAFTGRYSLHFHKDGSHGGTQAFSRMKPVVWKQARSARVRFACRYRHGNFLLFIRLRTRDGGSELRNEFGDAVMVSYALPASEVWTEFRKSFTLPWTYVKHQPRFQLQIQKYGQGDGYLDDVSFEVIPQ